MWTSIVIAATIAAFCTDVVNAQDHFQTGMARTQAWDANTAAPSISIALAADTFYGYNLALTITNPFTFAPELASTTHKPGSGHAHVTVGQKGLERLYCTTFHYDPLLHGDVFALFGSRADSRSPFRVSLNSNTHAEYTTADGTKIADTVAPLPSIFTTTFTRPTVATKAWAGAPTAAISFDSVEEDSASGYNVAISTTAFTIGAPGDTNANGYVLLTWRPSVAVGLPAYQSRMYCANKHIAIENGVDYDLTIAAFASDGKKYLSGASEISAKLTLVTPRVPCLEGCKTSFCRLAVASDFKASCLVSKCGPECSEALKIMTLNGCYGCAVECPASANHATAFTVDIASPSSVAALAKSAGCSGAVGLSITSSFIAILVAASVLHVIV